MKWKKFLFSPSYYDQLLMAAVVDGAAAATAAGSSNHSTSTVSEKCPRTSNCVANCRTMCANEGCSKSSAAGKGGSQRGRWCLPRKLRCNRIVTSQKTKRRMRVRRKSSPKNWTYDASVELKISISDAKTEQSTMFSPINPLPCSMSSIRHLVTRRDASVTKRSM